MADLPRVTDFDQSGFDSRAVPERILAPLLTLAGVLLCESGIHMDQYGSVDFCPLCRIDVQYAPHRRGCIWKEIEPDVSRLKNHRHNPR